MTQEDRTLIPEASLGRTTALWISVFFLGCLAATMIVDLFLPVDKPRLIGRERAVEQERREQARWLDGSRARLVERDLRLTSRVRSVFGPRYAAALYFGLDEASDRVVVGDGGRLFLSGRTRIPDRPREEAIDYNGARLRALDRRLARLGLRLTVAPVPRKSVVDRDFLPPTIDPHPELDEAIVPELRRRGVPAADLWSAFEEYRRENGADAELLYYKTDSHWTETAQHLAAEEICRIGGFGVEPERRSTSLRTRRVEPESDTLSLIGLGAVRDEYAHLLSEDAVVAWDVLRGETLIEHENPPEPTRIALVGTSFSAERKLPALLSHCAETVVWNAAQVGEHPLGALRDFLPDVRRRRAVRHLALELPGHNLFGHRPLEGIEALFAENPPLAASTPIPMRLENAVENSQITLHPEDEPVVVAALAAGRIAHDGDGIVELRLQGKVEGEVEILTTTDERTSNAPWPRSRSRVLAPLLSPRPQAGPILVRLRGEGVVSFEAIEAVAAVEKDLATAHVGRIQAEESGWRQVAHFGEEIPPQAGLIVKLDVQGPWDGAVQIRLLNESGAVLERAYEGLDRRAVAVVDLAPLSGDVLRAVRIAGAGNPPASVLRRATLAGLVRR